MLVLDFLLLVINSFVEIGKAISCTILKNEGGN
jgi:hypothetical protein